MRLFLTLFGGTLAFSQSLWAASEAEFEAFRREMIARECQIESTREGKEIQRALGWGDGKFSEVMLWLALEGEFKCNAGCTLKDWRCPKEQ